MEKKHNKFIEKTLQKSIYEIVYTLCDYILIWFTNKTGIELARVDRNNGHRKLQFRKG